MDIFYPADDLECYIQLASFFAWAMVARFGWHFADWQLQVWKDFFNPSANSSTASPAPSGPPSPGARLE